MSEWRTPHLEELSRLWPAVRGSHVFAAMGEFEEAYRSAPWRVRMNEAGDGMVLARWRAHLPALAIRAAWAPPDRMSSLLSDAVSVARRQGFETLLSPLLPQSMQGPYLAAGMTRTEELVVLQGVTTVDNSILAEGYVHRARVEDAVVLAYMDAACFEDFWRHEADEWADALRGERVTIAQGADGPTGYASAQIHGSVCTLGRLGVMPNARRRGIGRMLVQDVFAWAAEEGVSVVSLCTQRTNRASRALYASLGLIELEEPYALLGCDARTAEVSDTL